MVNFNPSSVLLPHFLVSLNGVLNNNILYNNNISDCDLKKSFRHCKTELLRIIDGIPLENFSA